MSWLSRFVPNHIVYVVSSITPLTTKLWVELVLRHSHQVQPEVYLSEQAAEDLVDESAYFDKKHARKSYAHEAGHVLPGLPDP